MAIYGTALLSFCLLAGMVVGKLLGPSLVFIIVRSIMESFA